MHYNALLAHHTAQVMLDGALLGALIFMLICARLTLRAITRAHERAERLRRRLALGSGVGSSGVLTIEAKGSGGAGSAGSDHVQRRPF